MCLRAPLTLTQDEENRAEELGRLPHISKPRLKGNHFLGPPSLTFALTLIPTEALLIASLGLHFSSLNRASQGSSSEATLQRYPALSRGLRFTIIHGW